MKKNKLPKQKHEIHDWVISEWATETRGGNPFKRPVFLEKHEHCTICGKNRTVIENSYSTCDDWTVPVMCLPIILFIVFTLIKHE